MKFSEAMDVLKAVCRAFPAYTEWRERIVDAQAATFGDTPGEAMESLEKAFALPLEDTPLDEAKAVVRDLAAGKTKSPPYGDMARFIAAEVIGRRKPREGQRVLNNTSPEPRYRCLHCRDTGICNALNPEFVRQFRSKFLAMTDGDFTDAKSVPWWHRAGQWWRSEGGRSPIDAAVACSCDAGRVRAEKLVRHNPTTMPVAHGRLDYRRALDEWYADGSNGGAVVWEVPEEAA